jgi:phage FluMu protein Com
MAKIRICCPQCRTLLQCDENRRHGKIKCPHCKTLVPIQSDAVPENSVVPGRRVTRSRWRKKLLLAAGCLFALIVIGLLASWFVYPPRVKWPDRRPVGVLFLASHAHSSVTNPRGWFNDPGLDVTGPNGAARFRQALFDYTDRSLAVLQRAGAQGVIVWDLEGEQFPHKTSFIGDPHQLHRLAPEMDAVADDFFAKLRAAGLRVGLTLRPQKIRYDEAGLPSQSGVFDEAGVLSEKMDYAKARWGATLFYVDSNNGVLRPDEPWQFRELAAAHPDCLLIPEHHGLPFWAFSAPYVALRRDSSDPVARWPRKIFAGAFGALDISDAADDWEEIVAARNRGDLLLFRAWFASPESQLLEKFAVENPSAAAKPSAHP